MGEAVLETERLTKRYGRRVAVDALSLTVRRGDIYGFLGQNGAGKSTTIRMALGLVRPTSGCVRMLGQDMSKHPQRALARTGAMVEAPAFYDNFTGRQNLRMLAALSGGVDRRRIDATLELVGLKARADDPVRAYSHGMRQRLGIAQALLPNPEFVILDEPTDGLDPQGIRETRELILRLRDELKLTVMLSSHLLHEVEQLCDRVAIIDGGRLLYEGGVAELTGDCETVRLRVDRPEEALRLLADDPTLAASRNGTQFIYVRASGERIADVNALLCARGLRVSEIAPHRETLEEAFTRLVRDACDRASRRASFDSRAREPRDE
jgi:ABC-2 type transport system ATP-binding protein